MNTKKCDRGRNRRGKKAIIALAPQVCGLLQKKEL